MKKIYFLLIIVLILSGCTVNVDVVITKDGNISENIKLNENKRIIENFEGTEKDYLEQKYSDYGMESIKDYSQDIFSDNENFGYIFKKNSDNICNTFTKSYFSNFFDNITCKAKEEELDISGTSTILKCTGSEEDYCSEQDEITINIELPEEAIENNATLVDGTKYTWKFNSKSNGKLKLKIKNYNKDTMQSTTNKDKEIKSTTNNTNTTQKANDNDSFKAAKYLLIMILCLIVVLVPIALVLYGKYKKNKLKY